MDSLHPSFQHFHRLMRRRRQVKPSNHTWPIPSVSPYLFDYVDCVSEDRLMDCARHVDTVPMDLQNNRDQSAEQGREAAFLSIQRLSFIYTSLRDFMLWKFQDSRCCILLMGKESRGAPRFCCDVDL